MSLAVIAVGTRRLTVRSVASLTVPTLMMVVPTTLASKTQSTLKPRISRPRIFKCRNDMAAFPRQHRRNGGVVTFSVNHEELENIASRKSTGALRARLRSSDDCLEGQS